MDTPGSLTLRPDMTEAEFDLFARVASRARRIVEFGAGGSTLFAVRETRADILSVEADPVWIATLREDADVAAAERVGRLSLIHVDIGPVEEWSWPADESRRMYWPDYADAPWGRGTNADFVLVDGRFRIACLLKTVLETPPGTVIAIHDFWNRPHYHAALPFLDQIESAETLGVFLRPETIDENRASVLLRDARFDPR